MGRRTPLTQKQLIEFANAYLRGTHVKDLAERFNISTSTVVGLRRRLDLPKRIQKHTHRVASPADIQAVREQFHRE